jgi:hypothetical protein
VTRRARVLVVVLAWTVAASPGFAASLAGRLHQFIDQNGFPTSGQFGEPYTPIIEKLALRGIDFPATATAPSYTYEFNFETGVPERSSGSIGPEFVERADTVGRGRFAFGVSELYADVTQFDGHDFAKDFVTAGRVQQGNLTVEQAFAATDFHLKSYVTSFSLTYGLTDVWDVNLLAPVVHTSLEVNGTSAAIAQIGSGPPQQATQQAGFGASATGLGDVLVRSKYRLYESDRVRVAAELGLRLPTGDAKNFHGLGDTTITPSLVLSRPWGRHDLHASFGVEYNADDLERTRARYALGASLQPWERVAFLVDVLGSSSFQDDHFTYSAPLVSKRVETTGIDDLIQSAQNGVVTAFVPRSDVVDLALGFKVNPFGSLVGFAEAIVPLTHDGLRAEVIPTAGVEWSF